jgi:hypothetical protein
MTRHVRNSGPVRGTRVFVLVVLLVGCSAASGPLPVTVAGGGPEGALDLDTLVEGQPVRVTLREGQAFAGDVVSVDPDTLRVRLVAERRASYAAARAVEDIGRDRIRWVHAAPEGGDTDAQRNWALWVSSALATALVVVRALTL